MTQNPEDLNFEEVPQFRIIQREEVEPKKVGRGDPALFDRHGNRRHGRRWNKDIDWDKIDRLLENPPRGNIKYALNVMTPLEKAAYKTDRDNVLHDLSRQKSRAKHQREQQKRDEEEERQRQEEARQRQEEEERGRLLPKRVTVIMDHTDENWRRFMNPDGDSENKLHDTATGPVGHSTVASDKTYRELMGFSSKNPYTLELDFSKLTL